MSDSKYDAYLTFDEPIPYKKLLVYPVKMKDYMFFYYYAQCFTLDKNSIPDIAIITMKYLDYIAYETERSNGERPYLFWFDRLLSLSLRNEKSFQNFEESMKRYIRRGGKVCFQIGDEFYDDSDFTELKKIISIQNMLILPDLKIQKELRDKMDEADRFRQKIGGGKPCSLEDQIIALSIYTGWKIEDIYGMTIRKFNKAIERADNILHYQIYLGASMSGMVEFKDKSVIKHWLSDLTRKKTTSLIEEDAVKKKINFSEKK